MISQLTEVYWLLLTLKDTAYVAGLYCSMLGWAYQRRVNGFAYQMAKENASVINEESGEEMFSVLARQQLGSSSVSKLDQVNRTYSDLRTYMDASKDMRIGRQLSEFHTGGRQTIKQKNESVGATAHHFKGVIRALMSNNHVAYDGDPRGYQNKAAGSRHQIPLLGHERFLARQVKRRTHQIRKKVFAKLGTFWVHSFASIWPTASKRRQGPDGMVVGPGSDDDSSSDESGSDESDDSDEGDDDMSDDPSEAGSSHDYMAQDLMEDYQHEEPDIKNNEDAEEVKQSREEEKKYEQSDHDTSDNQRNSDDEDRDVASCSDDDPFDEHSYNLSEGEREGICERTKRIRLYEAKPHKERLKEFAEHIAISKANLVHGKRVRTTTNPPVVKRNRRKGSGKS